MANTNPGALPGYETTYISRAELSDDNLKTIQERLAQVVASFGGEIVLTEDWGKRKMAYSIQKETRGHYTYLVYSGKPGVVHEVERNLRLQEHILRFLTVNLENEFDSAVFKKRRLDIHAAAKRREEEREARREERNAERRGYGDDRQDYRRHDMDEMEDLSGGAGEGDDE